MGNNNATNAALASNPNNVTGSYCGGGTTSSTSSKWLLSPTLEVSSEEKTSLINNLKTDSEGAGDCGRVDHLEQDDALVNLTGSAMTLPTGGFVKLPLEDRNKYEKLRSNDQPTSDDSDSEFFQDDYNTGSTTSKKAIFKQIVTNNIPDTIHKIQQAAYHKVDKTQIKVPIVKKLREKTTTKRPSTAAQQVAQQVNAALEKHEIQHQQAAAIAAAVAAADEAASKDNDEDADSIGSASDLRAEDDDFFDENQMNSVTRSNAKLKRPDMDGISESVKTCNSSAYHAECESVTTHEDDISRVVVKVRMRKKDRIAAAQASAAAAQSEINTAAGSVVTVGGGGVLACEESELSPTSSEFLNKLGDKPLLLDDELDYGSSADSSDSKNKSDSSENANSPVDIEHHQPNKRSLVVVKETKELDVFAMAPFKMPDRLPLKVKTETKIPIRRKSIEANSGSSLITPLNQTAEIWTSTPVKNTKTTFNDFHLPQTSASGITKQQRQPPQVGFDEFNEPIFNPFTTSLTQQQQNVFTNSSSTPQQIQSSSHYGMVTVISTTTPETMSMASSSSSSAFPISTATSVLPVAASSSEQRDLFDSEPFPQVISKCINNVVKPDHVNCQKSYNSHPNIVQVKTACPSSAATSCTSYNTESIQESRSSQLVTVNHSIIINKTPEPQTTTTPLQHQNPKNLILAPKLNVKAVAPLGTYVNVPAPPPPLHPTPQKSFNIFSGPSTKTQIVNALPPSNAFKSKQIIEVTSSPSNSQVLPISINSSSSSSVMMMGLTSSNATLSTASCQPSPSLPAHLCASSASEQSMFPIADNAFVQISQERCSDFTPDDEEEPVVLHAKHAADMDSTKASNSSGSISASATKLKEKKNHLGVRTLPSKLSQKVKAHTYKKVSADPSSPSSNTSGLTGAGLGSTTSLTLGSSSKQKHQRSKYKSHTNEYDDEEDYENMLSSSNTATTSAAAITQRHSKSFAGKSFGNSSTSSTMSSSFQSNSIQNSAKTGFSNMSFEDFPSDQEMDGGRRMAQATALPFEVVRNEKTLLEAEKKFGSLKRRNNLFS